MKQPLVFLVTLSLRDTNEELVEMMRTMKTARETDWDHVLCTFDGFAADPRDLWHIPEVRAMCRRLVTLGFVAYLDVFGVVNPDPNTHPLARMGFGSCEVWLIGEGVDIGQPTLVMDAETVGRLRAALVEANAASEAKCGAFGR